MQVILNGGDYGGQIHEISDLSNEISFKDVYDRIWVYGNFKTINDITSGELINIILPEIDKLSDEYSTLIIKQNKQKIIWEKIKELRDKLKFSGVKVGDNWFHSDPDSRSQQLALFTAALVNQLPSDPPIEWKTLTPEGGLIENITATMTPQLAIAIFQTTMIHDASFHYASDLHRVALLQCEDPETYDYSLGWPESFISYKENYFKNL